MEPCCPDVSASTIILILSSNKIFTAHHMNCVGKGELTIAFWSEKSERVVVMIHIFKVVSY